MKYRSVKNGLCLQVQPVVFIDFSKEQFIIIEFSKLQLFLELSVIAVNPDLFTLQLISRFPNCLAVYFQVLSNTSHNAVQLGFSDCS